MYSCISCGHIEIIKVYMGQNLSCVQVTGNKEFTTGGLMYHIYKCLHTCITNEKLARMYNHSYTYSSSAFLVHFKQHSSTDHIQSKYFFLPV